MIRTCFYVPVDKIASFELKCKRLKVGFSYSGISKSGYKPVHVDGDAFNVSSIEREVEKWCRETYEATVWYKILKFLKLDK